MEKEVPILGISFSGRKKGNCEQSLLYLRDNDLLHGDFRIIHFNEYDIKPCSDCNYECFQEKGKCPADDDFRGLFEEILEYDLILFAIPNYRGHSNALYRIFNERIQSIEDVEYHKYKSIFKGLIIAGNTTAGGSLAAHEIISDFDDDITTPESIILSSRYFRSRSIDGDIVNSELAKVMLSNFALNIRERK